jgi:FixJ family two-component response regulator
VLVVTAYTDAALQEKAKSSGADYILEKPVSSSKIREILFSSGVYTSESAKTDRMKPEFHKLHLPQRFVSRTA